MSDLIRFPRILILLMLLTFATFLGILFTPALPQIATDFAVSEAKAGWTMSIFLIGYAFGQLPYGPLANRFGRKKAIGIGVVIALIGTAMAYFSTSFWLLCLARFIQALGSGVGLKIAFTMVGDLHAGVSATHAISLLTLAFGIMPGVSTAIGGYITVSFGWQGCFLFLIIYILFLWLLTLFLPETAKELHPDALKWKNIAHRLYRQFSDPFLALHAFLVGLSTALTYIFVTLSPYLAINLIGLTPDQFGLWALVPSFGLLTGAFISRCLAGKLNPRLNMLSGILIVLIGTIAFSLCFTRSLVNPWTLFIPMYFVNMGANLIWSNASSKGLSEATDKSNASAAIQFINIGCATMGVFLVETVPPTTIILIPIAFGLIFLLMFAAWLKLRPHHQKR